MVNNDSNPTGLAHVFRALRYRNYRLFFIGQGISLIGTWMQQVAMSWLVYSLTNSAMLLGIVSFAGLIFTFIISPFAGVIVDRLDRRRILMTTQALAMAQALALAVVVLTGHAAIWNLIVLSATLGAINAFDMPGRQSFVLELVDDRADLGNAIALNSSLFNAARLIGPSIAGMLVALVGEGMCFMINGLSFIAVLACLAAIRITPGIAVTEHERFFRGMKSGMNYTLGFAPIKYTLLQISLAALVAMPYPVLMPIFAKEILKGDANTLGLLMAGSGVGAVVGAILLAARKSVRGLVKTIIMATLIFGLGLMSFAFSPFLWLSILCMAITGFGMVTQMAASNTFLQLIADDDKRGRVMSFYIMAFMGLAPFGSLLFGWLASTIGAPFTLLAGGICCVVGGVVFAGRFKSIRDQVMKVYLKKGLISE